ncbi:MAG: RimK family alpha-L-glutamate ligase [Bacillota bacterium]
MQAVILASYDGWHVKEISRALKRKNIQSRRIPISRLGAGIGLKFDVKSEDFVLDSADYIFVRVIPGGSLEQIILRMDILNRMAARGKKIINSPSVIEKTVDKYYTQFLLADEGIPTPETFVSEDFAEAVEFYHRWQDVILKPLFGSLGKGIVRITDEDTAYRVFRAWEMNNFVFYLQKYIPHGKSDIRAFVCDGKLIAASERCGSSWKTNVARGASSQKIELPAHIADMAVRSAEILNLKYAGIDIILEEGDYKSPFVIEVNSIPGWHGLQQVTDFNIADRIIDMLV